MKYEEIEENRDLYQQRMDDMEGLHMGTALLPDEDTPEELLDDFHELMTEHGAAGIEYAQEALHSEGGNYFIRFFAEGHEDYEGNGEHGVFDDFKMFREESLKYD